MKNILNIAWNDLKVYFSDNSNIFSLVGLPLILTVLLGIATQGSTASTVSYSLDVINQDNTAESTQFLSDLTTLNPSFVLCIQGQPFDERCELTDDAQITLESAKQRVQDGRVDAYLVIPSGFANAVTSGEAFALSFGSLGNLQTGDPIQTTISTTLQRWNTSIVAGRIGVQIGDEFPSGSIFEDDDARAEFSQQVRDLATTYQANNALTIDYQLTKVQAGTEQGFGQSIPGIGTMSVMFTVFVGVSILIKERKQWTLQRLVVLPLHRYEILGGKVLFYFTLGMIQYAVVFSVAIFTGTYLGRDMLALVLIMTAFVFCITALTLLLATIIKTQQQADGVTLLLAMTLAPLGGAWWPLEIVPQFMQVIGRFSPVSWAMDSYRSLIFLNGDLSTVLVNVGVLVMMGMVMFAIGVMRFKYE
jgi:ABC-2 type transport system permease protein